VVVIKMKVMTVIMRNLMVEEDTIENNVCVVDDNEEDNIRYGGDEYEDYKAM
jgi:hypothetical protein